MSLAEKWEELLKELDKKWHGSLPKHLEIMAQRAFYAGAEAALSSMPDQDILNYFNDIQAEIDRFKGLK